MNGCQDVPVGTRRSGPNLQWWERAWVALFGSFLAAANPGPSWLDVTLAVVGVAIVLAALGVVEVLMALYYRAKRHRRDRSSSFRVSA